MTMPFDDPELYVNVALGKPATQSSWPWWCPVGPDGLVDGEFTREYNAHTEVDDPAWWQVDLGQRLPLSAIIIHNRRELAREAARSLRVEVSEDGEAWTLIHAGLTHFRARGQASPLQLPLGGLIWARFVKVSLDERQPLVLTQVEVFVERPALEYIRLRTELGLDLPLLGEAPGAVEQMSYRLVGAPGTRDAPLIGLSLVLNPALGNGLIQHAMAIALARRLGLRYFQLAKRDISGVIARTEPVELGGIIFVPSTHSLPEGGWFLEGYFWELHEQSRFARDLLTPHDKREIVRTIIHPLFNLLPPVFERKPEDELIFHIRSGDVFSSWINAAYIQPPLSFYTLVIDRFLAAGRITRVKLVYENRMNPVIDALEAHLTARQIPFSVQSGTIVEDTSALVDGRHLAFGFGSLGPAICYLSDSVETLVSFPNGYDHKFREIPTVKNVVEVLDAGDYIKPGGWDNSTDQRRMMLEYPESKLRIEGTI
ncbi:discoidin domain-containing protein [Methylobacterium sp. NEAU 140]|uniref:discoidin domain-containing protein n=1 Tax=Methylobacterium sp. NEAU 140 TaxID=3064945 RepID=UPI0027368996|nr:discoidin domain-containing protein [Methylobacterium sp. NEAU 140]MDP4025850.1 discoidin domain-containing protein [Methylobacterium sp. NEAU 140]